MYKKTFFLITLFLQIFTITTVCIQYPHFYHLTKNNGLSNNHILCIVQDKYGFIWVGTRNGLNRYDGNKFKIYKTNPNDSKSISHNDINSLYIGHDSTLLIGTDKGLNRYNYELDNFDRFFQNIDNSNMRVRCILEDSFHQYWLGTMNGLYVLVNDKGLEYQIKMKYEVGINPDSSIVYNMINCLVEDSYKNVWIGTSSGLSLYNSISNSFRHYTYTQGCINCLSASNVRSLHEDSEGYLWIGTAWKGINRIKLSELSNPNMVIERFDGKDGLVGDNIRVIYGDKNRKLWVGTELGLHVYQNSTNKFKCFKNEISSNNYLTDQSILCITEDNNGSIWVGTYIGGINIYNSEYQKYTSINIPSYDGSILNLINCFTEDINGNIWIGSKRGGLHYLKYPDFRLVDYTEKARIKSFNVESMTVDGEQNIWFATINGISQINTKTGKIRQLHFNSEIKNIIVKDIFEDMDGHIWISTLGHGIHWLDKKKMRLADTLKIEQYLISNNIRNIYCVAEENYRNYWIGTDKGLIFYNAINEHYKIYNFKRDSLFGLRNNAINILYIDDGNNLWIGTDKGLHIKSKVTDDFLVLDKSHGMIENIIFGILQDKNGNIWVSTVSGISKINLPQKNINKDIYSYLLELLKDKENITNLINNFERIDGLANNEFNTKACSRLESGELLFGGIGGFIIINPDHIKKNTFKPPVVITDFYISNELVNVNNPSAPISKHISTLNEIELRYNENTFAFDFTALNYINPEDNTFKCKLIGYDNAWINLGNHNSHGYTKVPRGNYIFKVIAANNDGIWNEEGVSLKIRIHPPFWKTWWAYSIYFIIIGTLTFVFVRLVWNLKVTRIERDKINQLDLMKVRFFTNISHELKTPLTLIKAPVENMLNQESVDFNLLKIVSKNTNRLLKLVNQLLDFRKIETNNISLKVSYSNISNYIESILHSYFGMAEDKNIELKFHSNPTEIFAWFDPDIIEKVVYNLISNAIKYTPEDGIVKVDMNVKEKETNKSNTNQLVIDNTQKLIIKIIDTGIGIPKEYLGNVFDRFYQVKNPSQHKYTGSGIGLSLTKELVELHRGTVEVLSNNIGKNTGTTFIVKLPIYEDAYSEQERIVQYDEKQIEELYFDAEINGKRKQSILIVEDNEDVRFVIKNAFCSEFNIYEAENGQSGWKKSIEMIPDIIISDIVMHRMDGIELCNMLKNDERTDHIPVILLTALSSAQDKLKGLNTGADAYIPKPFSIDVLKAQINTILKNRQRLIEKFDNAEKLKTSEISATSQDERFLKKIIGIVEENMEDSKFDVTKLVSLSGLGRTVLYNKLNSLTGKSVNDFIQIIRLKKAAQLIKKNEYSISQVAYIVGFNDSHYFSRCFKKYFNKSPSEYLISRKN